MKTYNEMADEVFRIGDEQLEEIKLKKAKTKKAVITLSSCAAVFVLAIGLWKSDLIKIPGSPGARAATLKLLPKQILQSLGKRKRTQTAQTNPSLPLTTKCRTMVW